MERLLNIEHSSVFFLLFIFFWRERLHYVELFETFQWNFFHKNLHEIAREKKIVEWSHNNSTI